MISESGGRWCFRLKTSSEIGPALDENVTDHIRLIDTAAISSLFQRGGPQERVCVRIQETVIGSDPPSSWAGGRSIIFRGFAAERN